MGKIESCCIIDDDPIFIYGTKRIMKEIEFCENIIVFNNGQEALDGIMEISQSAMKIPQVIFLDLNMPIMNGWEFLDEFIKIPNSNLEKTIVYIISSSVDPRDLEKVKDYKQRVNNYILKPITPNDLESVLGALAL
ncbi:transcriptional regulator [Maribacter sp. 4U21]|uniref:response regulator n=1 Tax=Maribacter sp. 4U21 TaxID=1889779 RepID=UPI000C14BC05|nr:response regulator [Maribacter sp. 4U21]PIB27248.1 transcriptional regulator [Maribacter sp. 4U21]